jgi:hypothetical protein
MKKDFGPIFWLHLVLILAAFSSPFWLDWRIILAAVILLHVQWQVLGGCYLTQLEVGKESEATFYSHYLAKVFTHVDTQKVKFVTQTVLPVVVLGVAIIIQNL